MPGLKENSLRFFSASKSHIIPPTVQSIYKFTKLHYTPLPSPANPARKFRQNSWKNSINIFPFKNWLWLLRIVYCLLLTDSHAKMGFNSEWALLYKRFLQIIKCFIGKKQIGLYHIYKACEGFLCPGIRLQTANLYQLYVLIGLINECIRQRPYIYID